MEKKLNTSVNNESSHEKNIKVLTQFLLNTHVSKLFCSSTQHQQRISRGQKRIAVVEVEQTSCDLCCDAAGLSIQTWRTEGHWTPDCAPGPGCILLQGGPGPELEPRSESSPHTWCLMRDANWRTNHGTGDIDQYKIRTNFKVRFLQLHVIELILDDQFDSHSLKWIISCYDITSSVSGQIPSFLFIK